MAVGAEDEEGGDGADGVGLGDETVSTRSGKRAAMRVGARLHERIAVGVAVGDGQVPCMAAPT